METGLDRNLVATEKQTLDETRTSAFVKTQGLSKRYGRFVALDNVTLSIHRGRVVGLLGPNGSGKSTLLRLLLGFIKPTAGQASVGGFDCRSQTQSVHQLCSYLPGDARLDRGAKGIHLLRFFATVRSDGDYERSLALADKLELNLNRRVAFMSTGMRQKLALAICLSVDAPLIILDEPTANLDPTVRQQVLQLVLDAKQSNRAVIFSSHVLSEIEQTCDEVIFLRQGELMLHDKTATLKGGHRLLATPKAPLEIETALRDQIKLIYQDRDRLELELAQMNSATLAWLARQALTEVRIEAAGLQATYDRFHGLTEISDA
jgi:ABC-2 type transport system ATP-binding protein